MDKERNDKKPNSADEYPGIAINRADDDKVSKELVKERTHTLNSNPRH